MDYDIFSIKNNKRYFGYKKTENNKQKFIDLKIDFNLFNENKCLLIDQENNSNYEIEDLYKVYDKLFYLNFIDYNNILDTYKKEANEKVKSIMENVENNCIVNVTINYNNVGYKIFLPTTVENLANNILDRAVNSDGFFNFTSLDGLVIFNRVPVDFANLILKSISDFKNQRSASYFSLSYSKINNAITKEEIDFIINELYDLEMDGNDKGWGIVNNKLTFTITEPINGITITKWVNQNNTWIQVDITETILNKLKIN